MSLNITVLGVGGGSCNCINRIVESKIFDEFKNIEFCIADTDSQALSSSLAKTKIRLGNKTTGESVCNAPFVHKLLNCWIGEKTSNESGCNGDVNLGEKSAIESKKDITELLKNTDILLVLAGFGGGTGAGATPFIIETAKELGIIPIVVIIKPFSFEGSKRKEIAESGFNKIKKLVEFGVEVSNDKLIELAGEDATMEDAYRLVDEQVIIPFIKNLINLSSKMSNKNDFSAGCKDLLIVS